MERYWHELLNSRVYCERLAKANVIPLRIEPIRKIWEFFSRTGTSAGTPSMSLIGRFAGHEFRICMASAA